MEFKAKEIAAFLNGEIEGNEEITVTGVSKIEEGKPGTLAFLANLKYENHLYTTTASIVLVNRSFIPKKPVNATLIKVDDAYQALAKLLEMYVGAKNSQKSGIEQPSFIHNESTVGNNLYLGAFAYIGKNSKIGNNVKLYPNTFIGENVSVGDNCILYAGVKVYDDCIIGNNCVLHSGSVVGSDGFGFAPQKDGTYRKIPQIGNVIIEDNVEIGANTTIDCGTMGPTIIRKGAKIDNLIQVAHNCEIGENTVIAAQAGLAGSTKIGSGCMVGGQVGFAGHVVVGNNVSIGAQSGVVKPAKDNETLFGSPALPLKDQLKALSVFKNLPQLKKDVAALQREIKKIKDDNPR
ncbi:MAG: UDP-3-O-(3-hydroxymyristoyl)glucosamine N-acyltransferase [Draconibacterium sp.]|nr:MAG: UDP-3-O-(3-hydroxymyristoyl)glucosamine N-acyltransferase [Draconibacterium sp.]